MAKARQFAYHDELTGLPNRRLHPAGDSLLQQTATRLVACLRAPDTACRLGGDEFVILLPELEGEEGAVAAAEKIRGHLARPYLIDGTAIKITITTSIGMAIYPVDGEEYGELIRRADQAMYRDKPAVRPRRASSTVGMACAQSPERAQACSAINSRAIQKAELTCSVKWPG